MVLVHQEFTIHHVERSLISLHILELPQILCSWLFLTSLYGPIATENAMNVRICFSRASQQDLESLRLFASYSKIRLHHSLYRERFGTAMRVRE